MERRTHYSGKMVFIQNKIYFTLWYGPIIDQIYIDSTTMKNTFQLLQNKITTKNISYIPYNLNKYQEKCAAPPSGKVSLYSIYGMVVQISAVQ